MRLLRLCIEAASATIQIVGVGSSGWGDRGRVIFALVAGLANKKGPVFGPALWNHQMNARSSAGMGPSLCGLSTIPVRREPPSRRTSRTLQPSTIPHSVLGV